MDFATKTISLPFYEFFIDFLLNPKKIQKGEQVHVATITFNAS